MELVVLWCRGSKFADLMKKASVFEGSVIRCIRRLDELVVSLHGMCKVRPPALPQIPGARSGVEAAAAEQRHRGGGSGPGRGDRDTDAAASRGPSSPQPREARGTAAAAG